jgi:hypothetical protein
MTAIRAIGIDPGPRASVGIVRLDYPDGMQPGRIGVFQCTHADAALVLAALLREPWNGETYVGVERWVPSTRGGGGAAGERTRDLVGQLQLTVQAYNAEESFVMGKGFRYQNGAQFSLQNAGTVKTWATDERLTPSGLLKLTEGMRHARDGARHAIYVATHDGRIPDPLSKKARRADG